MTKELMLAAAVVSLVLCQSGCMSDREKMTRELIDATNEMTSTMKGIRDTETSRAAAPKLARLKARKEEIVNELTKMGQASPAEKKRLRKYGAQYMEAQEAYWRALHGSRARNMGQGQWRVRPGR